MSSPVQIPHEFMCPIALTIMNNPVDVVHGQTFDRDSIMCWFAKGGRKNPLNNLPLHSFYLKPNQKLRQQIQNYKQKIKDVSGEANQEGQIQKIQKLQFIESRAIRLFGSVSQQMEMKKKEIEVYKQNFKVWKKQFDQSMNSIEANVTICGRRSFIGQTKVGRRHGKGICYYENGSKYEGQWFHDYYHGKGIYTSPTGKLQYGEWKLGQLHGLGVYEDEAGCLYEGDLKYGTLTGKGVAYRNNQIYFEGQWKNGLRHGRGIRHLSQGKYEGQWKNGLRHGYGNVQIYSPEHVIHQKWVYGELVVEADNLKDCMIY